jgi:hypothetical protein
MSHDDGRSVSSLYAGKKGPDGKTAGERQQEALGECEVRAVTRYGKTYYTIDTATVRAAVGKPTICLQCVATDCPHIDAVRRFAR